MGLGIARANRLGFALLGLTNNFAYVIMLSAAYDLLERPTTSSPEPGQVAAPMEEPYCNEQSTSTILLADALPSLLTKLAYPFLFIALPGPVKASATAMLAAAAFLLTGLSNDRLLLYIGVICASFSSGLGECSFLSSTPLYGDVSLSGWSTGTGAAGLVGAGAYFLLRMCLPIRLIMVLMTMLVPTTMLLAYFCLIRPVVDSDQDTELQLGKARGKAPEPAAQEPAADGSQLTIMSVPSAAEPLDHEQLVGFGQKFAYLPTLAKFFLPLLLVYFAEYFINQGLFELIYYPEIQQLDHKSQYRLFQIRQIWSMSILQLANSFLFLGHVAKLYHLPNLYLVVGLIIYEGFLGGFTYVNTFYRIKKEVPVKRQEFAISTVTLADTLGIVIAGLVALPVHNELCKLYV